MKSGGHLPSVHSQVEQDQLNGVITEDWAGWIGGNDQEKEGTWSWSDGTPWNFSSWMDGFPSEAGDCVFHMTQGWKAHKGHNEKGSWRNTMCGGLIPFACYIPKQIDEDLFHLKQIIKLTHMARQANIQESELWSEAASIKTLYMSKELVSRGLFVKIGQMMIQPGQHRCTNGLLEKSHVAVLADTFLSKFSSIFQNVNVNATAYDWKTGFAIYTYLSLCPIEAIPVLEFFKHLVRTEDPRSIIQTSLKHLELENLPGKKYNQLAKTFFQEIIKFFNLRLGSNVRCISIGQLKNTICQVLGMSTKWEMEQMMEDNRIYLSNITNEAEGCLVNGDCSQLGQLLKGQGYNIIQGFLCSGSFYVQGQQS